MKYILGDNPFFGVNHKNGSKELESQEVRFNNAGNVILAAVNAGIEDLMISTHPDYENLLGRTNEIIGELHQGLSLALVIPYPHTLNKILAERGVFGLLGVVPWFRMHKIIAGIIKHIFFKDRQILARETFKSIIEIELKKLRGLDKIHVTHIALHNILTDICIANNWFDILDGFVAAVQAFKFKPVLISQNPVKVIELPYDQQVIRCFSYNLNGYMQNAPRPELIRALQKSKRADIPCWAMQILAAGAIPSENALSDPTLEYFEGILYATSRPERIREFSAIAEKYLGK